MLVATPYRDFDEPPRVISEIRKSCLEATPPHGFRPKLTGDLLVKCNNDTQWWPRKASVRNGQLQLAGGASPAYRLPLRHLSLQAGSLPNSLALSRGQTTILTIQAANEQLFDLWVKTIAIEIIRQTPLDSVKYLDIFTLANCWKRKDASAYKDCNFNYLDTRPDPVVIAEPAPDLQREKSPPAQGNEEKTVETLLKKCQNSESYVPVKEKLMLFESLCKLGRKVRSSEDVSCKSPTSPTSKRARSMHDLSSTHKAVREICKYFEVKSDNSVNNLTRYRTVVRHSHRLVTSSFL